MARQVSNNKPIIKFKLAEGAKPPSKGTPASACFDLYVHGTYDIYSYLVSPHATKVRTGVYADIPAGYHLEVYLRSSTGLKTYLRLANQVGIIDSDYKGEIILLVENLGRSLYVLHDGDRIAQCRLVKDEVYDWQQVDEIAESTHEGFGSTGR